MADKDPKTAGKNPKAAAPGAEAVDDSELEDAVGGYGGEHDVHSFADGTNEMPAWYSGGE